MKLQIIVVILLFAIGCWSIDIQQQSPVKSLIQKMSSKIQGKTKGMNLVGYPQAILKELNRYRRRQHYSPMIRWFNPLAVTAAQEADHIVNKRSFGQHANFWTWKKKTNNRFFTELSLHVDTEGMKTPKRIFAKTIVEALKQEQEWYLIHPYTHAGIAIIPGKKRNNYIIVIHLSRSPSRFHSCKEAQSLGIKRKVIHIFNGGKKYKVRCDQKTAGGGWTLLLNMNKESFGKVVQPINDRGIKKYTQLLFKAKQHYYFDYAKGGGALANNWDFDGYCFSLNALRFDDSWYLSKQSITHNGADERGKMKKTYYNVNKEDIQILKHATKCYFGKANRIDYCAKEFILKKLPKGRLNSISDVESIISKWTGDNQWKQFYQIFVR